MITKKFPDEIIAFWEEEEGGLGPFLVVEPNTLANRDGLTHKDGERFAIYKRVQDGEVEVSVKLKLGQEEK